MGERDPLAPMMENVADLYVKMTPELVRFALRFTADEDAAEDIVSEAFIRASDAWDARRTEGLDSWLYAIVGNAARDWVKNIRQHHLPYEIDNAVSPAASPLGDLLRVEAAEHLAFAMLKVPPRAQTALLLHLVDHVSHEDIAIQLGMTPGASKMLVHRTRQTLRRALASYVEGTSNAPRAVFVRRPCPVMSERVRILLHTLQAAREHRIPAKCHPRRSAVVRGLCDKCLRLDQELDRLESLPFREAPHALPAPRSLAPPLRRSFAVHRGTTSRPSRSLEPGAYRR